MIKLKNRLLSMYNTALQFRVVRGVLATHNRQPVFLIPDQSNFGMQRTTPIAVRECGYQIIERFRRYRSHDYQSKTLSKEYRHALYTAKESQDSLRK